MAESNFENIIGEDEQALKESLENSQGINGDADFHKQSILR
jgi:hypothetical protein